MPDWLLQAGRSPGRSVPDGVSALYICPMGGYPFIASTEALSQMLARDSYTWDRLYVRIRTNTLNGNTVVHSRIAGADGNQTVTIGAGATGAFEDNVNSDNLVAGNLFDWKFDTSASTSGSCYFTLVSSRLATGANTTPIIGISGDVDNSALTGNTYYSTIVGHFQFDATEVHSQYLIRVSATLSNLFLYVDANNIDGASTFRLRKNGANGNQSITIPAATTGSFEDAVNTDNVVSGNLLNYQMVCGGTSGTLACRNACMKCNSDGRWTGAGTPVDGAGHAFNSTFYICIEDFARTKSSIELDTQSEARADLDAAKMYVYIRSNGLDSATTITLRENGANTALAVSIGAGLTGAFEDLVDTIHIVNTDLINWQVVTGGSASDLRPSYIAFEQQQYTAPPPGAAPQAAMANKLIAERII